MLPFSNAAQILKITIIFPQNDNFSTRAIQEPLSILVVLILWVILSENSCHFVKLLTFAKRSHNSYFE